MEFVDTQVLELQTFHEAISAVVKYLLSYQNNSLVLRKVVSSTDLCGTDAVPREVVLPISTNLCGTDAKGSPGPYSLWVPGPDASSSDGGAKGDLGLEVHKCLMLDS